MKTIQYNGKKITVQIEEINSGTFYAMYFFGDYCVDERLLKGVCNVDEYCASIYKSLPVDEASRSDNQEQYVVV